MPAIQVALSSVMEAVGAVRKRDTNSQQGFNFRGIDAVVNAVSPALREQGVVVLPKVLDVRASTVEVGQKRTLMGHVSVTVRYRFVGPDGDHLDCVTVGEAMDSGDKATAKAMSVAFRTALLQSLALPTDEPDPDSQTYERAGAKTADELAAEQAERERLDLVNAVAFAAKEAGVDLVKIRNDWADAHDGQDIRNATDLGSLELLRDELREQKTTQTTEAQK